MKTRLKSTVRCGILLILASSCQLPGEANSGKDAQAMQQVLRKHKGLIPQKQRELFFYKQAQLLIKRYQSIRSSNGGHLPDKQAPLTVKVTSSTRK